MQFFLNIAVYKTMVRGQKIIMFKIKVESLKLQENEFKFVEFYEC